MRNNLAFHWDRKLPRARSFVILIQGVLLICCCVASTARTVYAAETDAPVAVLERLRNRCQDDITYSDWAGYQEGLEQLAVSNLSELLAFITGPDPANCRTMAVIAFASNPPQDSSGASQASRALISLFSEPAMRGAAMAALIGIGTAANDEIIKSLHSENRDVRYLAYTSLMVINRSQLELYPELNSYKPEGDPPALSQGAQFWKRWWDRTRREQSGTP